MCGKTTIHIDDDNYNAHIGNTASQQQQQQQQQTQQQTQQQGNTKYDQWNQQQEQMKQKIRQQQISLWNETYYKVMAAANGAEERTTHTNTITEKFSTATNEESIDKEHFILQVISIIATNKTPTSPVTTNRSHTVTIETEWRSIHTSQQSTATSSQYQLNLEQVNRS